MAAAAQIPSASTGSDGMLPPPYIPDATSQGEPPQTSQPSTKGKAKITLSLHAKSNNQAAAAPLWPWLVALAAIIILITILV
jgi:hypothetical protein